jgi:hypothetical protein
MIGGHFAPPRDNLRFADASVRGTIHLVERHCVALLLRLHYGSGPPTLPRLVDPANRKSPQPMSTPSAPFDLTAHGLTVTTVHHNLLSGEVKASAPKA